MRIFLRGVARDGVLDPMRILLTRRHDKGTSNTLTDLGTGSEENESKWPESKRRFIFGMLPRMGGILRRTSEFASQMWKTSLKAPWSSESQDGTEVKLEDKGGNIQSKHSPKQSSRPSYPKRLARHNPTQSSIHHKQQPSRRYTNGREREPQAQEKYDKSWL